MKVSYKKLWVMLAEREISKATLRKQAGLSSATFTKLRKNQEVTLSVMLKIADVLDYRFYLTEDTLRRHDGFYQG